MQLCWHAGNTVYLRIYYCTAKPGTRVLFSGGWNIGPLEYFRLYGALWRRRVNVLIDFCLQIMTTFCDNWCLHDGFIAWWNPKETFADRVSVCSVAVIVNVDLKISRDKYCCWVVIAETDFVDNALMLNRYLDVFTWMHTIVLSQLRYYHWDRLYVLWWWIDNGDRPII